MQNMCTIYGEGDIGLSKIMRIFHTRLIWYLIGVITFALLVCVSVGYLMIQTGTRGVERIFNNQQVNMNYQQRYMEKLQVYVMNYHITVDNISQLKEWSKNNRYVYISIYQNNRVIFNSDEVYTDEKEEDGMYSAPMTPSYTENTLIVSDTLHTLVLSDGSTASVDLFCYDNWRYNNYIWVISVGISVALFITLLATLLKNKFNYLNQLEQELQILEGGNLEYPVTVKGEDEIGNLAKGIEQMRVSVIENMQKEKRMLQANKDLVTAMSHDLRTPLTTLTGYLELLNMNPETEMQQRKRFLELSLQKTKEIKELSDELFEYFLIYGEDRKLIDTVPVSAYELVMDIIENQFLGLEERGFRIVAHNHVEPGIGNCRIHAGYMQRVMNNILSNLYKYADKKKTIEMIVNQEQKQLVIRIRNSVSENMDKHESTRIGLITCERIMKLHKGMFETYEAEGEFTVKLMIPLEQKQE